MATNIHIHESIETPKGECFFINNSGRSGMIDINTVLFGGEIFGDTYQGSISYLAGKINGFEENISNNPLRYQGLINCLAKSLIPKGQSKSREQKREHFQEFCRSLEFLYGYLGDIPELLEKNNKGNLVAQETIVGKLLEKGKQLTIQKRKEQQGRDFRNRTLDILGNPELPEEAHNYILSRFSKNKSPKLNELQEFGVSLELAKK